MLTNYLKTAIRSLRRRKSFSVINIAGLTLGLTAALLIALFVRDEFQYDKFIPGGEDVYRVYNDYHHATGSQINAVTPPAYATVLQTGFPAVEATTRVLMQGEYKALVEAGAKKLYEAHGRFADSAFFRMLQQFHRRMTDAVRPILLPLPEDPHQGIACLTAGSPVIHDVLLVDLVKKENNFQVREGLDPRKSFRRDRIGQDDFGDNASPEVIGNIRSRISDRRDWVDEISIYFN
jgi:hypothetical protein